MGLVMYALAPSCKARCRSSLEPSVMMMSNLPAASLRRPSTPSSASVTCTLFRRDKASTRSCRIIGESSTTRHEYWAFIAERLSFELYAAAAVPDKFLRASFAERLSVRKPATRQAPVVGGHEGAARVRADELEKLAVDRDEALFLLEQRVDDDGADGAILEQKRDACLRRRERFTLGDMRHPRQVRSLHDGQHGIERASAPPALFEADRRE